MEILERTKINGRNIKYLELVELNNREFVIGVKIRGHKCGFNVEVEEKDYRPIIRLLRSCPGVSKSKIKRGLKFN